MIASIILSTLDISTPDPMEHRLRASAPRILQMDFRESPKGEVRRIPIPGTSVNKDKKKGRGVAAAPASFSRVGLPLPLLLPLLLPWSSIRRLTRLANRLHAL